LSALLIVEPGRTAEFPELKGERAVYEWSARILGTRESREWSDPKRAHNAWRHVLLDIDFDGERSVSVPLGDFFGSAPGLNPYENLFFTVAPDGTMTSRLVMPFKTGMRLRLTNTGSIAYSIELKILAGRRPFAEGSYHLRAQWGTLTRETWPFFDLNFLDAKGEGKVVGTVYQIANPTRAIRRSSSTARRSPARSGRAPKTIMGSPMETTTPSSVPFTPRRGSTAPGAEGISA
jgi:hypothetical protein